MSKQGLAFLSSGLCICRDPQCTVPFGYCHCGNCRQKTSVAIQSQASMGYIQGMPRKFAYGHGRIKKRVVLECPISDGVARIPLTKGKEAILDAEDYSLLSGHLYYFSGGYAMRSIDTGRIDKNGRPARRRVPLHRDITQAPKGMSVDHVSGDTLDNRRVNLRVCSHAENLKNRKLSKANKSGHAGVWLDEKLRVWIVTIGVGGKLKQLGRFPYGQKNRAIQRRLNAEKEFYGEFAPTRNRG